MHKTLVVDDSESQRLLLTHYLKGVCRCDTAEEGAEAVDLFGRALDSGEPYAILLMDLDMPGVNGYQAMRRMRALEHGHGLYPPDTCRFIVVSSLGAGVSVAAESEGCLVDAFFLKPLTRDDLIRKIKGLSLLYGIGSAKAGG
jgi:two-component system chemotaxis response regulator CheY